MLEGSFKRSFAGNNSFKILKALSLTRQLYHSNWLILLSKQYALF